MRLGQRARAAVVACLVTGACGRQNQEGARPPVPVTAARVQVQTVPIRIDAIGHAVSPAVVTLRSRVDGQIVDVFFREGQDVRQGDKLFQIDPRPFQAALAQARAARARDLAQARNAEKDVERYRVLVRRRLAAQQDLDQRVTQAKSLRATVAADEAAIRTAQLNLEYSLIKSPIDGRTGILQVNRGNLVRANNDTLITIRQIQPMYVDFAVPSQRLEEIRKQATSGRLVVDASVPNGPSLHGQLVTMENTVDPSTGTVTMRASFANRQRALWPGEFVDVGLIVAMDAHARVVPARALQVSQQGDYVFVVRADSTVEQRSVRQGPRHGNLVAINEGLQPGELVVTDGQLGLTPGTRVQVQTVDAGAQQADATVLGD